MSTAIKTCFKCGIEKPLGDFYRHKAMADGRLGKCKGCTKKDAKSHRDSNYDRVLQNDRERQYRKAKSFCRLPDSHPAKFIGDYRVAWTIRNMGKHKAHMTLHSHKITGRIKKEPCEVCGNIEVDAHHDDYSKPLDVRWLCKKHHAEHHSNERLK